MNQCCYYYWEQHRPSCELGIPYMSENWSYYFWHSNTFVLLDRSWKCQVVTLRKRIVWYSKPKSGTQRLCRDWKTEIGSNLVYAFHRSRYADKKQLFHSPLPYPYNWNNWNKESLPRLAILDDVPKVRVDLFQIHQWKCKDDMKTLVYYARLTTDPVRESVEKATQEMAAHWTEQQKILADAEVIDV